MAGFRTITIPSAPDGGVDLDAFRAALGPKTAAIMITNPSTLGLFERADRRAARGDPRGRRPRLHGRRQPQRDPRPVPPGRGRLRRDALQRRTRRSARRTAAAARARDRSASASRWCRSCRRRASLREADGTFRLERDGRAARRRSAGCARSSAARASSCARTPTSGPTAARACARSSDDAVLAANYLKARLARHVPRPVRPAVQARVRRLGRGHQAPDRRPHPRHRQAADRQGLPPADDLLPAHGRGGDADRADRDRVARDARRASPTR